MNNGRIFTLFDLGRTDFAIRSGLGIKLIKIRWGLVVAGSTIQYRKRIRAFDKVTMKTRICAIDERWFYVEQTMWVKGKCTCHALLRTAVTDFKSGKALPTKEILDSLGHSDINLPPDEWVQAWIDADKLRPYPNE
ncbi:acyl-CoA thioesterase [Moraxella bovoculi]|uniref:acyl-CoA thioesterase n=1 Tax=Moraxella bovoculi TaxID=386891 RepID=UPI000B134BBD|nr:acyl-CoA thioesterase [Moraxella bovoculi]